MADSQARGVGATIGSSILATRCPALPRLTIRHKQTGMAGVIGAVAAAREAVVAAGVVTAVSSLASLPVVGARGSIRG
jgi:hypothetical protein